MKKWKGTFNGTLHDNVIIGESDDRWWAGSSRRTLFVTTHMHNKLLCIYGLFTHVNWHTLRTFFFFFTTASEKTWPGNSGYCNLYFWNDNSRRLRTTTGSSLRLWWRRHDCWFSERSDASELLVMCR